jgi:hypothetical protein
MSIRTTVTLDDDVVEQLKRESRSRESSFRDTLNDLLRMALASEKQSLAPANLRSGLFTWDTGAG